MLNDPQFTYFLFFGITITIACLAAVIVLKMRAIKQLRSTVNNLKRSLDEMDEQAKLIVRTDIELNKAQEELDKKIGELYALQKLSREITTTLEESQIFQKIGSAELGELGFEKAFAFLWEAKGFKLRLSLGYETSNLQRVITMINSEALYSEIITKAQVLSSASLSKQNPQLKEKICRVFDVYSFVITPILPKEANKGFLFVGTKNAGTFISAGDEELIAILANQLGQAMDNAKLFENTWRAQQDLENKVTERTNELTLALNEVKNISRRKTNFISSVSHELRTPLTSIKGYASILLAGKLGEVPQEVHERLEKINKHSDELVHMVNDLLDIARIESGKVIMNKESVDLKQISEEVSDLMSVQLKEKGILFSSNIAQEAKDVFADRGQIARVFINLIGNASKFTPSGGKISVNIRKLYNFAQIDISDTGCGISQEAQEKIFEEFYRVDNAVNQQVKGTGLGLSLVKHIIEAHGGKIWIKSEPGAGSTFSFTIPLAI
ncbi:MAG: GAF domain-containing sensor histidine kinase [Candidatus Omnitrophica bacterium]|nr:GAF domain-containing sensor histidine kinase [Candidatus Omnitrophota bacterium]